MKDPVTKSPALIVLRGLYGKPELEYINEQIAKLQDRKDLLEGKTGPLASLSYEMRLAFLDFEHTSLIFGYSRQSECQMPSAKPEYEQARDILIERIVQLEQQEKSATEGWAIRADPPR